MQMYVVDVASDRSSMLLRFKSKPEVVLEPPYKQFEPGASTVISIRELYPLLPFAPFPPFNPLLPLQTYVVEATSNGSSTEFLLTSSPEVAFTPP